MRQGSSNNKDKKQRQETKKCIACYEYLICTQFPLPLSFHVINYFLSVSNFPPFLFRYHISHLPRTGPLPASSIPIMTSCFLHIFGIGDETMRSSFGLERKSSKLDMTLQDSRDVRTSRNDVQWRRVWLVKWKGAGKDVNTEREDKERKRCWREMEWRLPCDAPQNSA